MSVVKYVSIPLSYYERLQLNKTIAVISGGIEYHFNILDRNTVFDTIGNSYYRLSHIKSDMVYMTVME